MKSLRVEAGGALSICEVSKPSYNDYQALVKVLACGVCNGTDSKIIHGNFKNMNDYPVLLGHEAVGEVVEKGSKVTNLNIGDIVLLPFLYEALDGNYPGWGAFSEYAVVGDAKACINDGIGENAAEFDESYYGQTVIRKEDNLDPVGAVMVITYREVLSAIRRFGFKANQSVVIFGAGPVGQIFIKFSKLIGMEKVIAVDVVDDKIEEAMKMGADAAFNSRGVDIEQEIRKLLPEGADYIVDAVGINSLINQAMKLIKDQGKICCYGISPKLGTELDWSMGPYNWTLQFEQFPSKKEEGEAHNQIMAWINSGELNPYDLISDVYDFDHILEAFEQVDKKLPRTKKIVVKYY